MRHCSGERSREQRERSLSGAPFRKTKFLASVLVEGGHVPALRLEGDDGYLGVVPPLLFEVQSRLEGRHDQSPLRRIPLHPEDPFSWIRDDSLHRRPMRRAISRLEPGRICTGPASRSP